MYVYYNLIIVHACCLTAKYWCFYVKQVEIPLHCASMNDIIPPCSTALENELILYSSVQEAQNVVLCG